MPTITGMTAVLAADLDDTARIAVDDNDGHTRKATIAQLRTALAAGAWTFGAAVTFSAIVTHTADLIATIIRRDTADGSDNSFLELAGGGTPSSDARGARILLYGNEHSPGSGGIRIATGAIGGAWIQFNTFGAERARISDGGIFLVGTTAEGDSVAGDIVLANGKELRGVNAAATGSRFLIGINSNNIVGLGGGYTGDAHVAILGLPAASLPAAGATFNGVIAFDTTNNRFVFYVGGNRYWIAGTSF